MTGEFSELRDAMESKGEKTPSSFDEDELFKPAEDPNEKELAPEQRKLTYKERRAIICLLYTSPSPRDRTRSRMPSSA